MSQSLLFDVFQFGMRTFTFAQIKWQYFVTTYYSPFLNQLNKKLIFFFGKDAEDASNSKNKKSPTIDVIKDGYSHASLPIEYIKYADLFVMCQDDNQTECQNIVAIDNPISRIQNVFDEYVYSKKLCNLKFISVEISINDLKFPIYLYKKDEYNYFIEGNIIDKKFLNYFIKHHKLVGEYVNVFEDDYSFLWVKEGNFELEIIDQDCNVIRMDGQQKLTLMEDTYNIS